MRIAVALIFAVSFAGAKAQDNSCHRNEDILTCRCAPNEDLEVFYDANDKITSLNVLSCASANLTAYMGSNLEYTVTSIRVENITNTLLFCPILYAENLTKIEILNVGYLGEFKTLCNFQLFTRLDYFHVENTVIGTFDQTFNLSRVMKFVLKNVMISNLHGLEFSSLLHGSELEIIDSYINVTKKTSLFFQTFDNIKIANTTFNFPYGGNVLISGTHIHLRNNTFLKASVDVMGKHGIHLIGTCAEGHGTAMRLHVTEPQLNHKSIVSRGNRMPSQIIYIPTLNDTDHICPGAKCDCSPIRPRNTVPGNYGKTIHQEINRGFLLCFIIIASRIVAKI